MVDTVTELNLPMSLVRLVIITRTFLLLAVHAGVAEALPELDHSSIHDEGGRVVLRLVLVEEQQDALAALFPLLPFDALGPFDVRVFVLLHVTELAGMFGRIDHPGSVPGPHGKLLQLAVQYQNHLTAQAVVYGSES
ncbi:hypothetical protein ABVT39_014008 [Epinephelus coioides]